MKAGEFPIDQLEPGAGEAMAAGAPDWLVVAYSIAISFRRLADALQPNTVLENDDEFCRRVFAVLDAGEPRP